MLFTAESGLQALLVNLIGRNNCDVVCIGDKMKIQQHLLSAKALPKITPPPDVIVMDGAQGIESVRLLQRTHGDTPLVMLTNSRETVWLNALARENALTERLRPLLWSKLWSHIERAELRQPSRESFASKRFWHSAMRSELAIPASA